jgi:hypothetical protein
MDIQTPPQLAVWIDNPIGISVMVLMVAYLFQYGHPCVAILSIWFAYELWRRSAQMTGFDALQQYAPSETKRNTQFTAFNQFPYTLEQEVVAKRAPLHSTELLSAPATYHPRVDNTHDADLLSAPTSSIL